MSRQIHAVQNISYGDHVAHIFLWLKALLLVPLWAIVLIPIVGFISRSLGHVAMDVAYGLTLFSCVIYFLVDVLKRRIRLDDEYMYFGFRAIPIKSIQSVDVIYKKGTFLPTDLAITCASADRLKLKLQGLSERSVGVLLKHLEVRNSNLQTAAVLNTLIKCRQVKPKLAVETADRVELPYHSRQLIDESIGVFKSTASRWARLGPVVALLLLGPVWIPFYSVLFFCLQPNSLSQVQYLDIPSFLFKFMDGLQHQAINSSQSASTSIQHLAGNNVVTALTCGFILALVLYIQKLLLRPNVLVADAKGVKLNLKCGQISVPLKRVAWSNIVRAGLHKPTQKAGLRSWKIRLTTRQAKNFDIDLSALAVDDRTLLLRRMEKLIPDCQIDYELSQSMVAKADHSYTELWLQSLTQAPERKTLEPLQPGQTVGENRFEVLKSIGVGGQGTAYLCRTIDDASQTIVLKETIIPVFGENALRRRALEKFEHESKMLKSLDCDGIVKLLDYFIEDHRAYLVLEHIDGGSLRDLVQREGALTHEQARDIALQMCDILKELHSKEIIHRDFTPDNLILNSKGKLKLIDFNVAQQVQSGTTGTIVGKHAYLPPEQFRGKATKQSDLYAFGATLFFLLTGQDPEPISQSSPQAANAAIDAGFDEIVKHATTLQASARYESADQIAADLLSMDDHRLSTVVLSTVVQRKVEAQVLEHG